jgi:Lon protease-like protein
MSTDATQPSQDLLPLFPLGLVLLPHMTLPLHIFEERYKLMINECLEQNRPFGIVYFDGQQVRKMGCSARTISVLEQYADGRMDIVTRGEKRFYTKHIDESRMYLQAGILFVDDAEEAATAEDDTLVNTALDLLSRLDQFTDSRRDYGQLAGMSLKQLSFVLVGSDGFTSEERQRFLEMTSTRERLRKGIKSLKKVIERAKINQEVAQIIGGNGYMPGYSVEKGTDPLI